MWSPWNKWDFTFWELIGIQTEEKYSTLKVKSLSGEIDIYIDDKYEGTVIDDETYAEINTVEKGSHVVRLKRKSDSNNYYEFIKEITFEPGVEVVMAYDLGPSEIFSEGHVLYTTKSYKANNNPILNIISFPDSVNTFIDGEQIGTTVINGLELDINMQHKIRFEKEGYDSLEFLILPESQENRDKLKGLIINLEVNLFYQPINIVK